MAMRVQGGKMVPADKGTIVMAAKRKGNKMAHDAEDIVRRIEDELMLTRRRNVGQDLERDLNIAQEYAIQVRIALTRLQQSLT
jgi:hypothetical protein